MGSVSPLIAVYQELKKRGHSLDALWIGAGSGPEQKVVSELGIPFKAIFCGKWRSYFDWLKFFVPILICFGFFQSLWILSSFKPDMILTAGGFVSVPVAYAAFLWRIPVWAHQQDARVGLANRLIGRVASRVTVSFQKSLNDFPCHKPIWTGNAIREDILKGDRDRGLSFLGFEKDIPVVLIVGGGTGALALNQLTADGLNSLAEFFQVGHLTGAGKAGGAVFQTTELIKKRYRQFEFLTAEMKDIYAASDIIVSRAGANALCEIALLGKPAIIIPIPDSHQEANAALFGKSGAALILDKKKLTAHDLARQIQLLWTDEERKKVFAKNLKKLVPRNGVYAIADLIEHGLGS